MMEYHETIQKICGYNTWCRYVVSMCEEVNNQVIGK